jgi:hypothetical protein
MKNILNSSSSMEKPAANFVGVVPADDLESIAMFLQVAISTRRGD